MLIQVHFLIHLMLRFKTVKRNISRFSDFRKFEGYNFNCSPRDLEYLESSRSSSKCF
jgi:hypothetical protein